MKKSDFIDKYHFIFWDFDGVILNSMAIRDVGFVKTLKEFSEDKVNLLLIYHRQNGGLSRYVKFRYFFEEILNKSVSEDKILHLANEFSLIMKKELANKDLLFNETVSFIQETQHKIKHVIVSGSDQNELRFLCEKLEISMFFNGIYGSPTAKIKLVDLLIELEQVEKNKACLIGDSKNDLEAAMVNNISFFGFNYTGKEKIQEITFTK